MKKIISLIIFYLLVHNVFAQVQIEKSTEKVIIGGKKYYIHTIENGHTLFSLSKTYEVSLNDIKEANPGLTDNLQLGQTLKIPILKEDVKETPKTGYFSYIIKSGDTLYSLCKKYGISQDEFYKINNDLKRDTPLKLGQEIKLPVQIADIQAKDDIIDTTKYYDHLVLRGETIYKITKEYNVTKEQIIEANPEFDGRKLKAGMHLKIPKAYIDLTNNGEMVDSLANIDLINDTIIEIINPCDSSRWYLNGKDFEISILLPLEGNNNIKTLYNQERTNKRQMIKDLSKQMVGFYAGCLSALDNYISDDINLKINVYDVGLGNDVISSLIDEKKLLNSDLIIGPAYKSQVEFINNKLANENLVFILPFINDENILKKYSNNIMISPTNSYIKESVVDYVLQIDTTKNIIIIQGSDSESIRISAEYQKLFNNRLGEDKIKIIKYDGKSLVSLSSTVIKGVENIFIPTIYDEASFTQILNNLFPLKNYDITFIGNELMLGYETIDPLYYSKVKFTYYSSLNIDYSNEETQKFLKNFRKNFLFEPSFGAFGGYDVMNYFVGNLMRYGNNFIDCFPNNLEYEGRSGLLKFETNSTYEVNSFSNKALYIYKINPDYKFELVYPENK